MRSRLRAQALDSSDRRAFHGPKRDVARWARPAVDQDHARSAKAFAATEAWTDQTEAASQEIQENRCRPGLDLNGLRVHGDGSHLSFGQGCQTKMSDE